MSPWGPSIWYDGISVGVTVSVGAIYRAAGQPASFDELFAHADDALHGATRGGTGHVGAHRANQTDSPSEPRAHGKLRAGDRRITATGLPSNGGDPVRISAEAMPLLRLDAPERSLAFGSRQWASPGCGSRRV